MGNKHGKLRTWPYVVFAIAALVVTALFAFNAYMNIDPVGSASLAVGYVGLAVASFLQRRNMIDSYNEFQSFKTKLTDMEGRLNTKLSKSSDEYKKMHNKLDILLGKVEKPVLADGSRRKSRGRR